MQKRLHKHFLILLTMEAWIHKELNFIGIIDNESKKEKKKTPDCLDISAPPFLDPGIY